MFFLLLFMGNEVVGWIMTNVPVTGFLVSICWLVWTIRGSTIKFDKEVVQLTNRVEKVETGLVAVNDRVAAVEVRVSNLEEKVTSIDKRLAVVEIKVDMLSGKVDDLSKQVERLDKKIDDKFDKIIELLNEKR